jgi:hypothetical protein
VTAEGRAMVASLGFVSILVFGGILARAGSIIRILFDDMVARCRFSILSHALVGCLFWGGISIIWTFFLGYQSFVWWDHRLEDSDVTRGESVWFAYISTTTVGLGDFFLQPEIMFLDDVLVFSLLFLTGFVFCATLLGKLGELIGNMFPANTGNKLKERVNRTSILFLDRRQSMSDENTEEKNKMLEMLKEMIKTEENNDSQSKTWSVIVEEEELLSKLLELKADQRVEMESDGTETVSRGLINTEEAYSHE